MNAERIRITVYRHSVFYTPLIATMSAGFLKAQGLDSTYQPKPKNRDLYDMFRTGEIDIMQAAVSTSWDPLSRGIRDIPVHFAQINQRDGFFLVSRQTDIPFEWKHLERSRLIADHAQQPFAMLRYGLHLAGVDAQMIEWINVGDPDAMEAAFRHGKGDYLHLQGGAPQQLEREGLGKVIACIGEVIPPIAFSSLMAKREFLESRAANAFMKAYRQALQWVNTASPLEIATAEVSYFPGISAKALATAIEKYQQIHCWKQDPQIPRDQYELAMDVFLFAGVFDKRFKYEDVVVAPPA
jgi:NitT/TauT family transport system substrate-binding protein